MAETMVAPTGPDLTQGIDMESLADGGMFTGPVGPDEFLSLVQGHGR